MKKKDGSPLNLITRIAPSFDDVGKNLLKDPNGHSVRVIRNDNIHDGQKAITKVILRTWLNRGGATCNYKYLIECIRKVDEEELVALAEDLEESHIAPK